MSVIELGRTTLVECIGLISVWLDTERSVVVNLRDVCKRISSTVLRALQQMFGSDPETLADTQGDLYRAVGQLSIEADCDIPNEKNVRDAMRLLAGVCRMLSLPAAAA